MNSNEQNNISQSLRIAMILVAIALIFIMFVILNKNIKSNYINVGGYKQKNTESVFSEVIEGSDFSENYEDDNIEDKSNVLDAFKEVITNTFNIKINGYAININDNTFGYVASTEERDLIIKDICKNYINELGLNIEDIKQIGIVGNIEATPYRINMSELKQSGELAQEIYYASLINDNLLGLQIKVDVVEAMPVNESTIIECSDELYIGQSEKIDGVKGESLVYKELTYDGLVKQDEKVISETIIKEPVATVIKRGSKNPYYDGVAFLYRPTRGGYMTAPFGEYRVSSYHKGIDIAKDLGDDVIAAFDGKAVSAGYNNGGYGNLIILEHEDNMQTYYAHLSDIYIKEGDSVKKGDVIGAIGSTGYSTGPHLHFELRVNGTPVNPENYIE